MPTRGSVKARDEDGFCIIARICRVFPLPRSDCLPRRLRPVCTDGIAHPLWPSWPLDGAGMRSTLLQIVILSVLARDAHAALGNFVLFPNRDSQGGVSYRYKLS